MGIPVLGVMGLICAIVYLAYTLYVQEAALLGRFPFIKNSTSRYHRFLNSSKAMAYLRAFEIAKAVYVTIISILMCMSVPEHYKSLLFKIIIGSIVVVAIIQMVVPRFLNGLLVKDNHI